jgi:hypothetical protein
MRSVRAVASAFLMVAFVFGAAFSAEAQESYALSWNANPELDVVGYRVHVGTSSRQYSRVYPTSAPLVRITDLPNGPIYFFAVTALNAAGLESAFSDEISSTAEPFSGSFLTPVLSSSSLTLSVQTSPGSTVAFESSIDLRNWSVYTNRTANSQGTATLSQPLNSMLPARFFRVRTP